MGRAILPLAIAIAVMAAAVTYTAAQEATPLADGERRCPVGMATPEASPMAAATAATPPLSATPAIVGGTPVATPRAAAVCAVEIAHFAFHPAVIIVEPGTAVVWENDDIAPHTTTADDGEWDSGRLDQGQTYRHTFDQPGTFDYHCGFHPNMRGAVIVR